MKRIKRGCVVLVFITFLLNLLPSTFVSASLDDSNIISTTNITVDVAKTWAKSKGATDTFILLADLYWNNASKSGGVNPAIAYVQAALETGYGNFGGVINESYFNPCGLKTATGGSDTDANAHAKFSSWEQGVQAHLDHLALYAGAVGYPKSSTPDPRHFASIYGKSTTVLGLSGTWAGSDYGTKVLTLYNDLLKTYTNSTSHGYLETPVYTDVVNTNTLDVKGWVISPNGINEVKIYVNGIYNKSITCDTERPDVQAIYPDYKNSLKSGYKTTVDISLTPNGTNTLKVEAISNGEVVKTESVNFIVNKPTPLQSIDLPTDKSKVSGNSLKISGWALNYSGIKQLQVYINNELKGTTNVGISRNDVARVYPQYPNANLSGYSVDVDTTNLLGGLNTIKLVQTGNDNSQYSSESTFYLDKLIPKGYIDKPIDNQVVEGTSVLVEGWSLNVSGIKKVEIYVDNNYVCDAKIGISRPDVANAFPNYSNASKSGFSASVGVSGLSAGYRTISVKQIGNDGTSIISNTQINVNKLKPMQYIDTPIVGQKINTKTLTVSGWSINSVDIKDIKVYLDDTLLGTTTASLTRDDVKKVYPSYSKAGSSGFSVTADISSFSAGDKTLKVVQTDINNITYITSEVINISKLKNMTEIDMPGSSVNSNKITVKGWALNSSGVKKVEIYLDNNLYATTTTGKSRTDVYNVYSAYSDKNSGYSSELDVTNLADGYKTLKVVQYGNDGTIDYNQRVIDIERPNPIIYVDQPNNNYSVKNGYITVSGWGISYSDVSSINIYVDNVLLQKTNIGNLREDVNKYYPNYPNSKNSGFSVQVDSNDINGGIRVLKVELVTKNGETVTDERKIQVQKLIPIECIDSPLTGTTVNSNVLKVTGWALNPSGVDKIQIFINGILKSEVKPSINRPDVQKVYTGYNNSDVCGFESSDIDISDIPTGDVQVSITQIGNDGIKSTTSSNSIKLTRKQSKICLDTPVDSYTELTNNLSIRGWTLNDSGVKSIDIYVDDVLTKSMSPNEIRDDVNKIYPNYANGNNSGFNTIIDIGSLSLGKHTLKAVSRGNDGSTAAISQTFYYKIKGYTIVIDPGHNYGGDYGATSTINGITYSETVLNMQIASYLAQYLQQAGFNVILTRQASDRDTAEVTQSLANRVNRANNANADLFVSIHQNSFSTGSPNGVEVYSLSTGVTPDSGYSWSNEADKRAKSDNLANIIVNNLATSTGFYNRGAKQANYYVLRNTNMPSVLVECGFISNPTDAVKLSQDSMQQTIARSICNSIISSFK